MAVPALVLGRARVASYRRKETRGVGARALLNNSPHLWYASIETSVHNVFSHQVLIELAHFRNGAIPVGLTIAIERIYCCCIISPIVPGICFT